MNVYVILSGYSEDYSEYGSLETDHFEGIAIMEDSAKLMASGFAERLRQDRPSAEYEYKNVPEGDPIIPENAVYLVGDHESSWYYYKKYEITDPKPVIKEE